MSSHSPQVSTLGIQDAPVRVGQVLLERYRIDRVLGRGAMGCVVAAWHLELEKSVAIKFMLPEHSSAPIVAARFIREARAASQLQSEHVIRVTDVGRLPTGAPYM